ncbi:MmcQ/YjbR family DNA-binding protein [Spirillospora sp. NPDC047279]|uniref:MmcQ/YjbR family DNA-binding protein n=1 Tax=Spirillospora sp. NPDC047279 TaxID=3155478 RepID=UPI0033F83E7A
MDPKERLTAICAAFPESVVEESPPHVGFKVRGKTFGWYTSDHHGDDREALTCKAAPGEQESLIAADPDRFFRPAYLGHRGWIGVRLDVAGVDWDEVAEMAAESYRLVAPKRLAAQLK